MSSSSDLNFASPCRFISQISENSAASTVPEISDIFISSALNLMRRESFIYINDAHRSERKVADIIPQNSKIISVTFEASSDSMHS